MRKKTDMAGFFQGTLRRVFGGLFVTGGYATGGTGVKQDVAVVAMGAGAGVAPNYDWSADMKTNTLILAGTVIGINLVGIPAGFTVNTVSSVTLPNGNIVVDGNSIRFLRAVLPGVSFNVSGTFANASALAGVATITITGDGVITNNGATSPY